MQIYQRWAERVRALFDRIPPRLGAVTVVGVLAAATVLTATQQTTLLERPPADLRQGAVNPCSPLQVSVARIEVTFSAHRFASYLDAENKDYDKDGDKPHDEHRCRANVVKSLVTWDQLFSPAYGLLLCAVYLWAERWRRFSPTGTPIDHDPSARRDFVVVAPLIAAVLDMVVENLPLWGAAQLLTAPEPHPTPSLIATALVVIGSTGALLKWLLLLVVVGGTAAELLSGPRGATLWRVRYSVFAVLFGGVPLLAIPQGQDIVQRLFESEHQIWRLWSTVLPVVFAALAVWYMARKLTELRLTALPSNDHGWSAFFGEQVPRQLGILVLILAGLSCAKAAQAADVFVAVAVADFFAALLARRYLPRTFGRIGGVFLPRDWRRVAGLDERVGRLLLGIVIGLLLIWPPGRGPQATSVFGLPDDANEQTALFLRIAAYLCIIAAWIFQLFVRFRRDVWHATRSEASLHPALESIDVDNLPPELTRTVVIGATLSVVWFIVATWAAVPVGRWLGPLAILSIVTVSMVFSGSVLIWVAQRLRVPVVTCGVVIALVFSLWNDNHRVRISRTGDAGDLTRQTIGEHYNEWTAALPPGTKHPVILVAAAGGGLRAAYWSAMSLAVLADAAPGFERHVFAISGISGGSLGGAVFAAVARDTTADNRHCDAPMNDTRRPPIVSGPFARCVREFMSDDHLSPVLAKLLFPDLAQWLLPFPVYSFDRSLALEESWETSYKTTIERDTFKEGFAKFDDDPQVRVRLPVLLLNSTHVETGRRYVTASAVRDASQDNLQNAGDTLDVLQHDLPLSTAVHNSARFTYVSPAGHLDRDDGKEHGHLVDGGYFENSGLASLREIYDLLGRTASDVHPYVLYLCNDPRACFGSDRNPGKDDTYRSAAADEVLSPIRALLRTRDARGSLAEANLRAIAADHFLQLNVCERMPPKAQPKKDSTEAKPPEESERLKTSRDRVVSPPLGWLLSRLARDWMDASLSYDPSNTNANDDCYAQNARVITTIKEALAGAPAEGAVATTR